MHMSHCCSLVEIDPLRRNQPLGGGFGEVKEKRRLKIMSGSRRRPPTSQIYTTTAEK